VTLELMEIQEFKVILVLLETQERMVILETKVIQV
jgi:hypothetical protein